MINFNKDCLTIIFWDVQHGNAIYIKTPNNTQIIYDLGIGDYNGNNSKFSPLLFLRKKYGIQKFDQIIISHPDLDHLADILNLASFSFHRFSRPHNITKNEIQEKINKSENETQKDIFREYLSLTEKYKYNVTPETDPTRPENNGGVNIELFYPLPDIMTNRTNNHSIVALISYASSKVMLTGDNESASWKELLVDQRFQKEIENTDIILASHHGRESGYYPDLFKFFKPDLTIVSDGHVCDTSATSRYSAISKGWAVFDQNGKSNERKCVTTRNDGMVVVKIGYDNDGRPYLNVRI
ncbi:hypothetical protein LCGC14_1002170 [marine sediment metagenome]|uniref:Metallo-beta-lactamase domain-containing protein n=1 Tax=marine sediment metagenome TaxID=412755 RepID=A0A0F9QL71_9ZZZZ